MEAQAGVICPDLPPRVVPHPMLVPAPVAPPPESGDLRPSKVERTTVSTARAYGASPSRADRLAIRRATGTRRPEDCKGLPLGGVAAGVGSGVLASPVTGVRALRHVAASRRVSPVTDSIPRLAAAEVGFPPNCVAAVKRRPGTLKVRRCHRAHTRWASIGGGSSDDSRAILQVVWGSGASLLIWEVRRLDIVNGQQSGKTARWN